jgi:heme exporter protein A
LEEGYLTELLLEARDLCCERDHRLLFEGLGFALERGQVLQVAGPNGSGKTTLLRFLSGISSAYVGEIRWCGSLLDAVMVSYRSQFMYLGHAPGVSLQLTALENLRWYFGLNETVAEDGLWWALGLVGLAGYEEVPAYRLSAGQQRRIALARLRLSQVPLWILDEPFTAIDLGAVGELERMLGEHARDGGAVVLTTHHTLNIDMPFSRLELGSKA